MTATMKVEDLKTIFDACKKYVSKEDRMPLLQRVQLNFFEGRCVAYAVEGRKLIGVTVPYAEGETGTLYVPIIKLPNPRKCHIVKLSGNETEVIFDFITDKQIFKKVEGKFIDAESTFAAYSDPEFTIAFDPANLKEALEGFLDSTIVTLDFWTSLEGCIITSNGTKKTLVLPRIKG